MALIETARARLNGEMGLTLSGRFSRSLRGVGLRNGPPRGTKERARLERDTRMEAGWP